MAALLVDLGGTYLRLGISLDGEEPLVMFRSRIQNLIEGTNRDEVWQKIITSISEFANEVRHIPAAAPIVVSFPGPVLNRSRIVDAPTVAGASSAFPDLQSILEKRTRRHVFVLNDISAAAWHLHRRVDARRFAVVTVSSGIGSKMFDRDRQPGVIDDVAYAGEIGHAKVDESPNAPICDCGGRGHLGAISSGRGILRFARQTAQTDALFPTSMCVQRFHATADSLTNEDHLAPAVKAGDRWALQVVRECTKPLARVLLQWVMAAGLERVVVIGGFALSLGESYRAILKDEILKRCDYRLLAGRLEDVIVMGDDDACFLGAAVFASQLNSL
jgi:glucokinase